MKSLEHVDFQNSFVLDWKREEEDLVFYIDACLLPKHANYQNPASGEVACWKPGKLVFESPKSIEGLRPKSECPFTTGPGGFCDYGEIDEFDAEADGQCVFSGNFGSITVVGTMPRFSLTALE